MSESTPSTRPPMVSSERLTYLKILSILYYVYGGLSLLFGLFPLIYVLFGIIMAGASFVAEKQDEQIALIGGGIFMAVIGVLASVLCLCIGGITVWAGRCLQKQQHWMVCMIGGAVACLNVPIGTCLAVFTFINILDPEVKKLFEANSKALKEVKAAPPESTEST